MLSGDEQENDIVSGEGPALDWVSPSERASERTSGLGIMSDLASTEVACDPRGKPRSGGSSSGELSLSDVEVSLILRGGKLLHK